MAENLREKLLQAALSHVPFDGWSEATLAAAAADVGIAVSEARGLYPRGAVDMAAAYHKRGDAAMLDRLAASDLATMRYSERVVAAVRFRLQAAEDKEIVRRGMTLFALPQHAAEGSQLIWGTADHIWTALGDTSDDINWYSKRVILSGVFGSVVLFWLGDTSEGDAATWGFLDRRIADVMRFEKLKAQLRESPVLSNLLRIPEAFLKNVKAPSRSPRSDLPGHWPPSTQDNS